MEVGCDLMQVWEIKDVQLGSNGKPDLAALQQVLITDPKHRRRSQTAEEQTVKARAKHALPVGASNGGSVTADPHSKDQILLSEGRDHTSLLRNAH